MVMPQQLFIHQQVVIQVVLSWSWLMGRQSLSTILLTTTVGLLRPLEETQLVQVHMVFGEQWEPRLVGKLFPSRNWRSSFFSG
jgi:hypothetical protein